MAMAWRAVLSMIMVQVFKAGMQLLSRVILVNGAFVFSVISYRHVVATISLVPFALYFERGPAKKLCWSACFWVFLNALVGTTTLSLYFHGLTDTTATYSITFLNVVPIVTFLISIIFKMEKLRLGTWAGKIKTLGVFVCVGGALITTLYVGKKFYIGGHSSHSVSAKAHKTHMLRGTLLLVGSCISYALWFIVQVKLLKALPLKFWAVLLTCIMMSVDPAIVGLCIDRSKASWSLGWNLELLTIVYSGLFVSAVTFYLVCWIGTLKGPTYPPMFNPLSLVIVAFSEAIFLGEPLTVGILVGMVFITTGLYCFLWGKSKETRVLVEPNEVAMPADSKSEVIPISSST